MYTPKPNEETRVEVMHELIRAHPLGTWTLLGADDLLTQHVPFLLDAGRGPFGTLVGHVARANSVWRSPATPVRSVVPGAAGVGVEIPIERLLGALRRRRDPGGDLWVEV
jgi:predicted FMN-binding regulatory protein PaiB